MTIEGPNRIPWPRWRVMAFMASLSSAAGLSAELYVTQLMTSCAISAEIGEN
jgi:hypothetical protein